MDKRRFERILVSLDAELILNDKSYVGQIASLSEKGLFMRFISKKTSIDYVPGTPVDVQFKSPSSETINLRCEVIWLHIDKTPPQGLKNSLGLIIMEQHPKYKDFLKTL